MFYLIIGLIFAVSVIFAVRSMGDFDMPKELRRFVDSKRIKGTIIFLKGKIKHYPSSSSGSSV